MPFPSFMFGPLPCPRHYPRHWATMASADFCPITPRIAPRHAMSLLDRCCLIRSYRPTASRYAQACSTSGLTGRFHKHAGHRPVGQISPDKNVNFPYTATAFTISPEPRASLCCAHSAGSGHPEQSRRVLTYPETWPYMLFLFVGS